MILLLQPTLAEHYGVIDLICVRTLWTHLEVGGLLEVLTTAAATGDGRRGRSKDDLPQPQAPSLFYDAPKQLPRAILCAACKRGNMHSTRPLLQTCHVHGDVGFPGVAGL